MYVTPLVSDMQADFSKFEKIFSAAGHSVDFEKPTNMVC
jgi:hypothetical protein